MNLGIFLSPGDSLEKQKQSGQLDRFLKYYLEPYSKNFDQVYLFTYGDNGCSYSLPSNLTLIYKPKLIPNCFYQLSLAFIHKKIIQTIDINRVFQTPGGIPALISRIFFHKSYIVTYGYDYVNFAKKDKKNLLALVLSLIVPLVLKFAKNIIVTTPENQKIARSILIPNGVDPDIFKPSQRESNLIVSVGRLELQKRYDLLIKAVSQSRYQSRIKLVIIGQGSKAFELNLLAKKLNVKLKLINNLPYLQLVAWYQKATIFVLTSDYEGHPKTLIEALGCGCPVLTTNFSGNPITQNLDGLISQRSDLSKCLDRLLADKKLRQSLGGRARELVVNRYDLKQLVKREIQLLLS